MPTGNDFGQRPSQLSVLPTLGVSDIIVVTQGSQTYKMPISVLRTFIRKEDVGLANADNTADMAKPVSTAALALFTSINSQLTTITTNITNLTTTKAEQSNLSDLATRVTAVETSKANQTALDAISTSVAQLGTQKLNASDYTDQTAAIAAKAAQTDLNALTTRVTAVETDKASVATVSALTTVVGSKASQADLNAANAAIADKASQAQVDGINSSVTGMASTIGALTTTVSSKASQADLTALTTRMTTVESGKASQVDLASTQATVTAHTGSIGTLQTQTAANTTAISNLQQQVSNLSIPINIPEWTVHKTVGTTTIDVMLDFQNCNGYNMSTVQIKVGYREAGTSGAFTYMPNEPFVNGDLSYMVALTGLTSAQAYEIQASLVDSNSSAAFIAGTLLTITATTN